MICQGPKSILLADDDRGFASEMASSLSEKTRCVRIALGPHDALSIAARLRIDTVVLEPNQQGATWVRFLRSMRARLPGARFFVITAFSSRAMFDLCRELSVEAFTTKPVSPAQAARWVDNGSPLPQPAFPPSDPTLDDWQWEYVNQILLECDGNVSKTCRYLRIPRQTLYCKLRKPSRSHGSDGVDYAYHQDSARSPRSATLEVLSRPTIHAPDPADEALLAGRENRARPRERG